MTKPLQALIENLRASIAFTIPPTTSSHVSPPPAYTICGSVSTPNPLPHVTTSWLSMAEPQAAPRDGPSELGKAAIDRFCCQYLQLEAHFDYPDGQLLKRPEIQDEIFERIFAGSSPSSKSARFQLRVLKELVKRIQDSISDNEADDFVCKFDKQSYIISSTDVF